MLEEKENYNNKMNYFNDESFPDIGYESRDYYKDDDEFCPSSITEDISIIRNDNDRKINNYF